MIKPRSAIARIGVGLAIVAGLSMGAPLPHHLLKRSLTLPRFLAFRRARMPELPHARTTKIEISLFNVLARAQLAIARKKIHPQSIFGFKAIRESHCACTWTVPITLKERAT